MARYENLPIFAKAMKLVVLLEESVRQFSRYHKYSIGKDLRESARSLVDLVLVSNSKTDKVPHLEQLRDQAEKMKVTLVIAKEIKAFKNFRQFELAAQVAIEIAKQSEGWLKSQRKAGLNPKK